MYSTCVYANLLNGPTIYRKLGNANIARTYIDTDSHKQKQLKVKIVITICQTSNQSATMEQNYCSSVYFLTTEVLTLNVDTGLSATVL